MLYIKKKSLLGLKGYRKPTDPLNVRPALMDYMSSQNRGSASQTADTNDWRTAKVQSLLTPHTASIEGRHTITSKGKLDPAISMSQPSADHSTLDTQNRLMMQAITATTGTNTLAPATPNSPKIGGYAFRNAHT
jgi:hypothetical protein